MIVKDNILSHQYRNLDYDKQHKNYNSIIETNLNNSNGLKLTTDKLQLNIDYDLPLIQLQHTKTRKYKQNLNPIFQLLSTNNHRYNNHTQHQVPQRLYTKQKLSKEQYKTKQRILPYQSQKDSLILQQSQQLNNRDSRKDKKFFIGQNINQSINQVANKDYSYQQLCNSSKQVKIKQQQSQQQYQQQQYFLTRKQAGENLIKFIKSKIETINNNQIEQSKQKLLILKQKLSMLKQKNILKQRQIYFTNKQQQKQQLNSIQLHKSLTTKLNQYQNTQSQQHSLYNELKQKKRQLKKQQKWLQQQNSSITKIKKKIQGYLISMRTLQSEQQKRQHLLQLILQQQQQHKQLQTQLSQNKTQLQGLQKQIQLLQQETSTLQLHQTQLQNLQLKFKQQTQNIQQHLYSLNSSYQSKIELIQQQSQIDSIIKDLQLQIGQYHQQKIFIQEHIQQIHLKISIKNNNIKHIKNNNTKSLYHHQKQLQQQQQQQYYHQQHNNYKQKPSISIPISTINSLNSNKHTYNKFNPNNKVALPTIRQQQSKNTSLYQTPKNQQFSITQQSHHPFSSNSLSNHSQITSQNQTQKHYDQKQHKKYFIIESQEDQSNHKSIHALRKTQDFFFNKNQKTSIQHAIQQPNQNNKHQTTEQDYETSSEHHIQSYNKQSKQFGSRHQNQSSFLEMKIPVKRKDKSQQKKSSKKEKQVDNDSQYAFQNLIQRFEHIKSNSYFDEDWKQKI